MLLKILIKNCGGGKTVGINQRLDKFLYSNEDINQIT